MEGIRLISTSMVRPLNHFRPSHDKTELTPSDLQRLMMDYIQKGLLFHRPTHHSNVIDHLKTSLSHTLQFFPPLVGRLATVEHEDETTSFFIDCNDAGVMFVHAAADDVTMADILEPIYVPQIVHSFFPLNGVLSCEGISNPLLAVQVTELVDGIFIGCSGNHSVIDGTSFWHFFNSWSEISRGKYHISKPPILKRWFFDTTVHPIRLPFSQDKQLHNRYFPQPWKERIFHFTKEKIAALKAKANAEMNTNRISSLQVILGHIWHSVTRIWHLDDEDNTAYRITVGLRHRLHPPLPENYLGNAILSCVTSTKSGEMVKNGIGYAAWHINTIVSTQTADEVIEYFKNWVKGPIFFDIHDVPCNTLVTISSPRFNVYGNDFGWGNPVAVRSGGANKINGALIVYQGIDEGSVDVEACFLPKTFHDLENDAEFMDAMTA